MVPKQAEVPSAAPVLQSGANQVSASAQTTPPVPTKEQPKMVLPTLVFGVVEVHRLQRELESLEEFLQQAALRSSGEKNTDTLPRISRLLDALASENSCNLLKKPERERLAQFLQTVGESAPSIHMSFATDPSAAFTAKIVSWLRVNIHPLVLLQIGLQPSIAAGTVIRTTNHVFDLSLRKHFDEQKAQLVSSLDGGAQ